MAKMELAVGLGDVGVKGGFLCSREIWILIKVDGLEYVLKRLWVTEAINICGEGKRVIRSSQDKLQEVSLFFPMFGDLGLHKVTSGWWCTSRL